MEDNKTGFFFVRGVLEDKKVFFLKTRKTRKTNYLKTTIATIDNKIKIKGTAKDSNYVKG